MFRNRTTSQKPNDDLYKHFKASFPQLGDCALPTSTAAQEAALLTDALDVTLNAGHFAAPHHQETKSADLTPRGSNEQWNFASSGLTPSVLDPGSHSFNAFANELTGYYTPTAGGVNTLFHSQHAGDLHTTPGFSMGLGTPLSLPTSNGSMSLGQQAAPMHQFQMPPQMHHQIQMPSQQFHSMNPYQMHQTHSFAPQHFQHQPNSYESLRPTSSNSPIDNPAMDINLQQQLPQALYSSQSYNGADQAPPLHMSATENFRYFTTLNAPTAMIKSSDEIPITYLNKGQAYTLNVADTESPHSMVGQLKYRTFVRVSFEDEQQRERPGACWQLWKEGRGTNEAHQRGGRLQAVEFVDASQMSGGNEDPMRPKIELESASFDGFCVTWSPGASGLAECPISVRFNFLSTDFSHSKGVKGIPVRLCSKTELLFDSMSPSQQPTHEICYCKVKLFRDHGAERKLSNDVSHVKKTIDKLQQQIAQAESGMRDGAKRKRSNSNSKHGGGQRPGKVQKHKRSWSMASDASSGGRGTAEDDMHVKLMTLQDMFASTRLASVLFLRGVEADDADLHPVKLGEESHETVKAESNETATWERQSEQTGPASTIVSPTPSSQSLASPGRRSSMFHRGSNTFAPSSHASTNEWKHQAQTATMDLQASNPQHLASPPAQSVKVQTHSPTSGTLSGWIEASGVDHSYQPPVERAIKPAACFYIQPRVIGRAREDNLYRAVYVVQRTVKDFVNAAASKCDIDPTLITRTVRVSRKGLQVLIDDDGIREMADGQDMTAEFSPVTGSSAAKSTRGWDFGSTDIQVDGDIGAGTKHNPSSGYELKLLY